MIKTIMVIVKRLIVSITVLYAVNLLLQNINIIIPINIFTIILCSILGIPGICALIVLFLIMN